MSGSRPLLLVLVASLVVSLAIAWFVPLFAPDEVRNAEVAREMSSNGDGVVPHLAGMPYLDKPPALFWLAALSIRGFGHTPFAARVPSILAALLTLFLIGRAAARAGGARLGWVAPALLAAAPLFAGLSAYVIFDMLLALCVTFVWLAVARDVDGGASLGTRVAAFAAIALGLLTKGPVMLAWGIGGSLGAALLLRSLAPLRWIAWWPGWIVALAPPAIWLALVAHRFPEFPHYALIEETFERISTGSFHRDQPWWFVPVTLIGGALPWSLATPWSRARWRGATASARSAAVIGLGFALFGAVFFTLSHSKLVTYLLPAFPPLAFVSALMWSHHPVRGLRVAELGAILAFTPILLIGASPFVAGTSAPSGAPLARAIAAQGGGPVRYEGCYSPGADYLLGRTSTLVTETGRETTSNYLMRYRELLAARGLWKALARPPAREDARFIVRPARSVEPPPAGATEFHRDRMFVAYRTGAGSTPPAP